jgi:uncharacterized protein YbjT (DUF2867 family)
VILLCGGTGMLGSRVAASLAGRGVAFRALVRPGTDATELERLGQAEIVRGDLRDERSLAAAMVGIRTIVSTASAFLRMSGAGTDLNLRDVDHDGYMKLIAAAEHANVDRFVFVSLSPRLLAVNTPLSEAKLAVEERLRSSSLAEVIVQADLMQELSLNPAARVDWVNRVAAIPGHGDAKIAYVAADDVAELLASIALEDDPPRSVEVGGPEQMSRKDAIGVLEGVLAAPVKRRSAPRFVFRAVTVLARRLRPALASEFGLVLAADLADTEATDQPLRQRGIEPHSVEAYFKRVTASA